jgi:predicted DNA-binding ribbon-helix-helix protein
MRSPVFKRSVVISGHKTSVSAEAEFWNALKDIAVSQNRHLSDLVTEIDKTRQAGNLSSAIRLYVLDHFQKRASAAVCPRSACEASLDSSDGAGAAEVPEAHDRAALSDRRSRRLPRRAPSALPATGANSANG